jgi:5-methylcytosine-specific restriction endonuclease McrA
MRVLVLSSSRKPLMPCNPARARMLLKNKKAAVFRTFPFTIILQDRDNGETQPLEVKIDPGSKTTGISLVLHGEKSKKVVFAAHLEHRGQTIKKKLEQRRGVRRSRRQRKSRYRMPRFNNRTRRKGWLPPSLQSRVENVKTWVQRLERFSPVSEAAVETVRFDTQKMVTPEISGVEYQQGELLGYEVREYLLEKWERKCAYCEKDQIPLQIEHVIPRSKGGSNRISNLCLACEKCNQKKADRPVEEFLKGNPDLLKKIKINLKKSLKDAAAVNATRYAIGTAIKEIGIPTTFWSGGRTKFNRSSQNYKKDHWIDAACVGETGEKIFIPKSGSLLRITAQGHGDRQLCLVDQYGFPRSKPAGSKIIHGFQTGDYVTAKVTSGKKVGTYKGRVAVRSSGSFNITSRKKTVQGISYKACQKLHCADGYGYSWEKIHVTTKA